MSKLRDAARALLENVEAMTTIGPGLISQKHIDALREALEEEERYELAAYRAARAEKPGEGSTP